MFPAVLLFILDRKHKPHFFLTVGYVPFPDNVVIYGIKPYSDDLLGSVLLFDYFYWIQVYFTGLPENSNSLSSNEWGYIIFCLIIRL